MPDLTDLEAKVLEAQQAFREALVAWKRASGQPPRFLLDKAAPTLRGGALKDTRVFADRRDMMLAIVAPGGTGAEVGVQRGDFSRFLIDRLAPAALHLFDMSDHLLRDDVRGAECVHLHLGDSSSQLGRLPDASFDWIYIDGDHGYEGAMKDARAALQKIRAGGLVLFNDYTTWSPGEVMPYGVVAVVNELVNEGARMVAVALTPSGYFDVALRPASDR